MKNNTITGERLKECRIAAGYKKQEDVAKILNVQRQIISYYETGERFPKVDDLVKLAKLYNTSTDFLLGLSDVATTDTELKAVCEYTGLTEDALKNLKALTTKEDKKCSISFLLFEKIFDFTKDLVELLEARQKICETEQLEQQKDMFQHIRITGYDGVYSAIDIDSTEEGTTYAIFKPDNSRGVNLLCEIRDEDSLIYLANTSCTTVNTALK